MNILHFNLGVPPFRSGGLTKYSIDLIKEQSKKHNVILLFPGKFTITNKFKIKKSSKFNTIMTYEIINGITVPLLDGIGDVTLFINKKKNEEFIIEDFLLKIKPEIIHIHTLMGLPITFVKVANKLGIRTIYTSHDYFGICPKVNLIDFNGEYCTDYEFGEKCIKCNNNPLSLNKMKILQSNTYRVIKEFNIVKKLRANHKSNIMREKSCINNRSTSESYIKLRNTYISILEDISYIHYNSENTKKVYEQYISNSGKVIHLTHKDISERYVKKDNFEDKLKILYLGDCLKYKGYDFLIESLSTLKNSEWELNIYGNSFERESLGLSNHISFHGRYNVEILQQAIKKNDLLIIPSICNETFGFTVLEGLSMAIPIIVTNRVGAKDLIQDKKTGFIIPTDTKELSLIINKIMNDKNILKQINQNIIKGFHVKNIQENSEEIISLYNYVRSKV